MKDILIITTILLLFKGGLALASQLVVKDAQALTSAKYVVLGRVTTSTFDQNKFTGMMEIAIIETLKGKTERKSLKLPVDKTPISGFDLLLNKGDVAVFFIRELQDGKAVLIAPGASASFSQEYFK